MLKVQLLVALAVCVASCAAVQSAGRCPDGYWRDTDGALCIRTTFNSVMTLADAEKYCTGLPGRIFQPTATTTSMLKEYADDVYLENQDRWERYWVGLTQDLSDAWRRNVVDRGNGGPFCVALDYRRPVNAQQLSFYGYDSPTCRTDVELPVICAVDATMQISEIPASPDPIGRLPNDCPDLAPCPDCPLTACPVIHCPAIEPCKNVVPPPRPLPSTGCLDTWFTRRGFCYHFIVAGQTWQAASASCGKDGADLVSILDKEENDYLGTISDELSVASPTIRRYWIGLSDREQEGTMTWASGDPVRFTSWGPRQPSGHKKRHYEENCVVINSHNAGLWDDIPCWRRHPYICKKAAKI